MSDGPVVRCRGREAEPTDGHVPALHQGTARGEERAINELLRREAEGREEVSEHEVERCECARLWQQNSRLMHEHGLKGKRGRW